MASDANCFGKIMVVVVFGQFFLKHGSNKWQLWVLTDVLVGQFQELLNTMLQDDPDVQPQKLPKRR